MVSSFETVKQVLSMETVRHGAKMLTLLLFMAHADSVRGMVSTPVQTGGWSPVESSVEQQSHSYDQLLRHIVAIPADVRVKLGLSYREGVPYEPDTAELEKLASYFRNELSVQVGNAQLFRQALMYLSIGNPDIQHTDIVAYPTGSESAGAVVYNQDQVVRAMQTANRDVGSAQYAVFVEYLTDALGYSSEQARTIMANPADFITGVESANDAVQIQIVHAYDCAQYALRAIDSVSALPWESDLISNPNSTIDALTQALSQRDAVMYNNIQQGTHYFLWYHNADQLDVQNGSWLIIEKSTGQATQIPGTTYTGTNVDGSGYSYDDQLYDYNSSEHRARRARPGFWDRVHISGGISIGVGLAPVTQFGGVDWYSQPLSTTFVPKPLSETFQGADYGRSFNAGFGPQDPNTKAQQQRAPELNQETRENDIRNGVRLPSKSNNSKRKQ